jgi:hypothetical protein
VEEVQDFSLSMMKEVEKEYSLYMIEEVEE